MYGHRYFGNRYYGNRYFGDGGNAPPVGGGDGPASRLGKILRYLAYYARRR